MEELQLTILGGREYGQHWFKIRDMPLEQALEKLNSVLSEKYDIHLHTTIINRRRGRRSRSSRPPACLGGGPRRIIRRRR